MKNFSGNVLFLDRSDINTDEIIPAKYLTEITKAAMGPHLLEDLCLDGFTPGKSTRDKQIVITRANFGCGSSREHAPWALEANGINVVIASSLARIFRQNMLNCGLLALELPPDIIATLFETFAPHATRLDMDLDGSVFTLKTADCSKRYPFEMPPFDRALVEAGGWVAYADQHY
ncbi:MAG: 3-isopropylmalate dehydratase small subunit [Desulfosarcina sp.]|nr:3-isopropylmalate dehydratase small subunit [Desulfobacterales bacterium]